MIDTAALEEYLADDPRALEAFLNGKRALALPAAPSEALDLAEMEAADARAEDLPDATAVREEPPASAVLLTVARSMQLRALQVVDALPMRPQRRIDMLA